MRIQLNPELTAYPFDGAGQIPQTVCELPHVSGRPIRMLLPSSVYQLLCECDAAPDPDSLIEALITQSQGRRSADQLTKLVHEQLLPRHILVDADAPRLASKVKRRDNYLLCKVRLFPPSIVNFCARRLLWLTSTSIVLPLLAVILLVHLLVYVSALGHSLPTFATLSGPSLLLVALALTVEVLWHEFGHATALVRFGGKRPEIGWGIYLWYSVFFADLSEAWRMPRRDRVRVDLAGMYFQAMFLLLYGALWFTTHRQVWFHIFYLSDLQLAANLNPFLRMDGYWALIDALGLNSLRGFSLMALLRDITGRSDGQYSTLPLHTRRVVLGYTAFSMLFYAGIVVILLEQTKALIRLYPATITSVHHALTTHAHLAVIAGSIAQLAWRTLLLGAASAVMVRMLLRLLRAILPKSPNGTPLLKRRTSYATSI
jgi:putative peptide zinc metalloprotease protein